MSRNKRIRALDSNKQATALMEGFCAQTDEHLAGLSNGEQLQYLTGLVHALTIWGENAIPGNLSPVDIVQFVYSARTQAYNRANGLDSNTALTEYMAASVGGHARSYEVAAALNGALGMPLTNEQQRTLVNLVLASK